MNKMDEVKSLQDLGYGFNDDGELRILKDGEPGDEPFDFKISDHHSECQDHYEVVGDAVTQHVYHLLETQENLKRLPVPVDGTEDESTFIFVSEDYDHKDTLLVLIHGSGVVRAGQWARSLIINGNLAMGTQIPYIKKARANGYGVLIMNTNENYTQSGADVPGSSTPVKHGRYVWKNYVAKTKAKNIVIVAHSYGGVVTAKLAKRQKTDFENRVRAIAFTDSVHGFLDSGLAEFFKQVTRNWVSSDAPLDTPMYTSDFDVTCVSAGHSKHEMTSYACMESVFKFFDEKLSTSGSATPEIAIPDPSSEQAVPELATSEPATSQPLTPEPATPEKPIFVSATSEPTISEPATSEQAPELSASEPLSTELATSKTSPLTTSSL